MPIARLVRAAAAAVLATVATVATAAPFTVNYAPANGSTENTGSTASATFSFSTYNPMDPTPPNFSLSGADLVLRVDVTNTTPAPLLSTLVALAFDFPTGYTTQAGYYDPGTSPFTSFLANGDAQLNPLTGFDVCVRAGDNGTCNGGNPQSGLTVGQSATFYFGFDTASTVAAAETAFAAQFIEGCETAARFQQVGQPGSGLGGSDKVCGRLVSNGGQVPAPAPLALLGVGLVGLALRRRAA